MKNGQPRLTIFLWLFLFSPGLMDDAGYSQNVLPCKVWVIRRGLSVGNKREGPAGPCSSVSLRVGLCRLAGTLHQQGMDGEGADLGEARAKSPHRVGAPHAHLNLGEGVLAAIGFLIALRTAQACLLLAIIRRTALDLESLQRGICGGELSDSGGGATGKRQRAQQNEMF